MKSKIHLQGHPLHPILVSFPIAFFIGSLFFDILGLAYSRITFHETSRFLATGGIGFALLAAIPGLIDYLFTVPPNSTGKARAAKHGLINTTVVIVFISALLLGNKDNVSMGLITGLKGLGVILLSIAGWMGGTLVYRNQIGVDIRYAHAGKWKEEFVEEKREVFEVAQSEELKVGQMKLLRVGKKRIVVGRTENGYAVFDDQCTHRGGSLAGGALICGTVQCPWHGSQFNVNTGIVVAGPAKENIKTYSVTESNGKVFVNLDLPAQ
jgi:nitrite reductase/ring-hydroxylating ferredoxin subunit/uncharacterized membrane protein